MGRTAIVIGGGIAGASVAFELSSRGVETTLVDAGLTGQATAASAGIIQPWTSSATGAFYDLYAAGAAHYTTVLSELTALGVTSTAYSRHGGLCVDTDEDAIDRAYARVQDRRADAGGLIGDVKRLTSTQLQQMFPPLAGAMHGFVVTGGARVFRDALLAGARLRGARAIEASASLSPEGDVLIDGESHRADVVVAAAGTWTNRLLEPLELHAPVHPQRGQITHLRLPGVDTSGWPTVHMGDHYIVAFDDSRVAVGATREHDAGFDARVTAAGQASILDKALALAPGLGEATFIETRVGLRPYPDDELPVFGLVPGHKGLYLITGFGAAGLTMGPYIGALVAEAAATGIQPEHATIGDRLSPIEPR